MEQLISTLFEARTQTHIFHLQTKSYAEHIALNEFYDSIIGLVDGLVESYQGKYGIITGYTGPAKFDDYTNSNVIKYLKALSIFVERQSKSIKKEDTYLLNQIDTIIQLIYSTIYKLENLK